MHKSLKQKFQAFYTSKKPIGDLTCPAGLHRVNRAWNCIKEKMDCSNGKGILNHVVSAGAGNGDNDVDGEE